MKSTLADVPAAIRISRATLKNIKENLFWAFFYNSVGIPLAAGAFIALLGWEMNPMFGAAAMSLSSFCVVSNALRLKLFKPILPSVSQITHTDAHKNHCKTDDSDCFADVNKEEIIITNQESECCSMEKVMMIDGMMCPHCTGRVSQLLNAIDGVSAVVSLEDKNAKITLTKDVADEVLVKTVTDAGYTVVSLN